MAKDDNWYPRVIRHKEGDQDWFDIWDVRHSDDGTPLERGIHEIFPLGNSIDELRDDLERICDALNEPVISEEYFEKPVENNDAEESENYCVNCDNEGCEDCKEEAEEPESEST